MIPAEIASTARGLYPRAWCYALLAAVSIGGLLLLPLAAPYLFSASKTATTIARYEGVGALRLFAVHAVSVDVQRSILTAIGPDPYITLEPAAEDPPVSALRMKIRPISPAMGNNFAVYFVPASGPWQRFSDQHVVTATIDASLPDWTIDWTLPETARAWRIDLPEGAEFHLEYVEVRGARGLPTVAPWIAIVSSGALIAMLLVLWQFLGRPIVPATQTIKSVLILSLIVPLAMFVFVLPPFQGPDENAHWKLALMFYRSSIAREPAAYFLPETLEIDAIPFHPERKFKPQTLRADNSPPVLNRQAMANQHQYLLKQYPYTHIISYPVVWMISLLFPFANTVPSALQLFYLCRIVPAILTVILLYVLNRKYELPYTAWFFFSLPLVVQQFVVVSADTLLNVGAIAAVLLFLTLRERSSRLLTAVLWALCLGITYAKFIAAGVLLLPLLLVPYRRLPRPKMLLVFAVLTSLPVVYLLGGVVLSAVRDVGRALNRLPDVEQQIALIRTWVGVKNFVGAMSSFAAQGASFEAWSGPLGWLDTPISPRHLSIITASCLVALLLDVWVYGPRLVHLLRKRTGEMTLLAGAALAALTFALVIDALLYYLMTSAVGSRSIAGTQIRHLFAAAIVAVLLPLAVLGPTVPEGNRSRGRSMMVANSVALVLLPMLFFASNVELAIDLLTRYWG